MKFKLNEFLDGIQCCKDGEPCPIWATEAFVRGFKFQQWSEQQATEKNMKQENRNENIG